MIYKRTAEYVEAIEWKGNNIEEVKEFFKTSKSECEIKNKKILIKPSLTDIMWLTAHVGYWLVKPFHGHIVPFASGNFDKLFDEEQK